MSRPSRMNRYSPVSLPRSRFGDAEARNEKVLPCTLVAQRSARVYDSLKNDGEPDHADTGSTVDLQVGSDSKPLLVQGDFKVSFFDKDKWNADDKMFELWLNTRLLSRTPTMSFVRTELVQVLAQSKAAYQEQLGRVAAQSFELVFGD